MKRAVLCVALLLCMLLSSCQTQQVQAWYDFPLADYITVGEYKNLSYSPVDPVIVTDEAVEEEIQGVLDRCSYSEVLTDGVYQTGDEIKMDFVGVCEGLEPRSVKGYITSIGKKNFFDEFDGGLSVLVGQPIQAKHELDMTYKADHSKADWAGKTLKVTMTVISVTRYHKAELTDAFVQSLGGAEQTAEQYRAAVRAALEAKAVQEAHEAELNAVWDAVLSNSRVTLYPQKELNGYVEFFNAHYAKQAAELGMEVNDFMMLYYGVNEDRILSNAKNVVKQDLVMFSICQKEGIAVSSEEYTAFAEGLRVQKGLGSVAELEASLGKDYVEKAALLSRLQETLLTWAVPIQAPEASTAAPLVSSQASASAAASSSAI